MATNGPGGFDNDGAVDWLYELAKSRGLDVVKSALEAVDSEPDAVTSVCAVAAAEVVAALRGRPTDDLPDEVVQFIDRTDAGLVDDAVLALANGAVRGGV